MAGTVAMGKLEKHLHVLLFWLISCILVSCGSSRVSPNYLDNGETAITIDSLIPADQSVEAYIRPYKTELDAQLDSVIGFAAKELTKEEVESTLGNFVADLTRDAAQRVTEVPIDMGVVTIGGLRMPLPEGPIRIREVYEVMPFENWIVVLRLTGEQAQQLFEFAAAKNIVAISNSKIVVAGGKPIHIYVDGKPFDKTKTYIVATSDYLANGGDNMSFFKDAEVINAPDLLLRTAIVNKIVALQQAGQKIDAEIEGRVEVEVEVEE